MKYAYESINFDGLTIAEAIASLQAWEAENPEAVGAYINLTSNGEYAECEINFQRPYTAAEIEQNEIYAQRAREYQEEKDRQDYERLKAKYEGN